MKSSKLFVSSFAKKTEIEPQCLNDLILSAQKGSLEARNKIVSHMSTWIVKKQVARIGVHCKENLYDMAIDAIYLAIADYDPTMGASYTSWCETKFRGEAWKYKNTRHFEELTEIESDSDYDREKKTLREEISKLLESMPEKHRKVLVDRFGLDDNPENTSKAMAVETKISRSAMTCRVRSALKIAKKICTKEPL